MGHHSLSFLCPLISFPLHPQKEITSSKVLFPEHLPLSRIQAGIKSGSFLQGTFRASRDNYLEATVFVQGEGEDSTEVCVCVCTFCLRTNSVAGSEEESKRIHYKYIDCQR